MENTHITQTQKKIDALKKPIETIQEEMSTVIIGQKVLISRLLIALLTRSHILLEGVPGLAKTTAIATLAKILKLQFQRIQFTPDLLPSDLIGSRIFHMKDSSFSIKKGPIFANFILADEINRSPAKVQSALLEAMQEKQVTIGDETFPLPLPFFVMATQNPVEQEGTYNLPEAQVDRFLLKTVIDYPNKEEELMIINQAEEKKPHKVKSLVEHGHITDLQDLVKEVYIDESIKQYIVDIVFASRYPEKAELKKATPLIAYGASPRASIGLMQAAKALALLHERAYVIPEDIKEIAPDILRHRIIVTYEADAESITSDDVIRMILDNVRVP